MFECDYLMRILVELAAAIRRSMERAEQKEDVAESAEALDEAVGRAVDMDGDMLLALSPESVADVMKVSGVDPRVTECVARSLMLSGSYYAEAGSEGLAELRRAQAQAVAAAFGHVLPAADELTDAMDEFLEEAEQKR